MNNKIIYSVIAVLIVSGVVGTSLLSVESADDEPGDEPSASDFLGLTGDLELPTTFDVGVLLSATGDLSSHGYDNSLAVQLAASDFNDYLDSIDSEYTLNLVVEDTQTDPVIALEKLQSLNSKGIKLIVGTESSAELNNVKSYADSNGMILVSPSSTSPKLSLVDNIYRLVPDDTKQGNVLAKLFAHDELDVVIPIWRADVWGDGLQASAKSSFESLGGTVDMGIRYSQQSTVFSTEASLLDATVRKYLDMGYTHDDIGVLMIGFAEVVHMFNFVSSYDNLHQVRWYGTDASSNDDALLHDSIAADFAHDVNFISTQFAVSTNNELYHKLDAYVNEETGSSPNTYAYSSYDALWVLGLSALESRSLNADDLKAVIHDVVFEYDGAIGSIELNENGDLAKADYRLWTIHEGDWVSYGRYLVDTDTFEFESWTGVT